MRVAIFGESYLPYLSGVTVATEALAHGLAAAGHEVLLVAPAPAKGSQPGSAAVDGEHAGDAAAFGVAWLPSFQAPPPAPPGYRIPWPIPSSALRAAAAFRPQVIHAQSPFTSGLMARRLARLTGAALVFTHHTRFGDYGHYLGPIGTALGGVLEAYLRSYWRGCQAVVAPSRDLAAEISASLREGGSRRGGPVVRAIPTGIDVAAIAGLEPIDPRPAAGWPPDALVVASLGRLALEKSVDLLVEAFAVAATRDRRLRLLLLGEGPDRRTLERRAAEADLSGLVRITGLLARTSALASLAAADLFAFASRTETQGLVLAEALASGLPVLAIDGPGVRDSVRDGVEGLIVAAEPAGDRAARLGDAITELARDPTRRAAFAAAAREGAARFDASIRVGEMVALYGELTGADCPGL
jgi:glycosyltransferase involved in cell wall biosynthesis